MKFIKPIVFILYLIQTTNCQGGINAFWNLISSLGNSPEIQEIASNLSKNISNYVVNEFAPMYNTVNDVLLPLQLVLETETECNRQVRMLLKGLHNKEIWAIKMLDASSKLQPGLLYGNLFHFGNFEECIEIKHRYQNKELKVASQIKGKYCTTLVTFGNTSASMVREQKFDENSLSMMAQMISISLCVPSGCFADDLTNITNTIFENQPAINFIFIDKFCSTEDTKTEIPTRTVIALAIFAFFGLIIVLGTFLDIYRVNGYNVIKCFSFYTNGKKLFLTNTSADSLHCLNGIRVLSMMFVLLGHRFISAQGIPAVNKVYVEKMEGEWYNYVFIGLGFSVDTFFTVSGLLIVYLYKRGYDKGKVTPWAMFYLHRILRLTPSLLMVVLFYATMLKFIEEQPFVFLDEIFGQNCREYWWTTILYIQNYWNPNDMCAVQTWYLAIDTQLYLLSPLLLIAFTKFPKKAVFGVLLLTVVSMGLAVAITWEKKLGATYLSQGLDEYKYIYTPTHIRVPPWLFGALTGYFIAKNKEKKFPMEKLTVLLLWILSLGTLLFVLLIQKVFHDTEYNVWNSALFNALARPLWGAAICLIIWLCVFGHGGFINSFLSCSLFNVLIRINYAFYLLNMLVVMMTVSKKLKTPMYLSDFSVVHEALGDYFFVLLAATIWTLAFESPIIALEKILFSKARDQQKHNLDDKSNDSKASCETIIMK